MTVFPKSDNGIKCFNRIFIRGTQRLLNIKIFLLNTIHTIISIYDAFIHTFYMMSFI